MVENAGNSAHLEMPYDKNLLNCANTMWLFGDWENLAQLNSDILYEHPDGAKLALLAASGLLQIGKYNEGRQLINLSSELGASKKLIYQTIISGVYNSIARAAAISNYQQRAFDHFESAIRLVNNNKSNQLIIEARRTHQLQQLGLLAMKGSLNLANRKPELKFIAEAAVPDWIEEALTYAPDAPALLVAAAEAAQRSGKLDKAIRYWQRLASVEGVSMNQCYYDRLSDAYEHIKSFPIGNEEEESLSGDVDKHKLLKKIHQITKPRSYLEIGVQTGRSLLISECPSLGIDPMPMVSVPLPDNITIVRATSDHFFLDKAPEMILEPLDMAFIDGMHLFEYVLRDFINVEKYSSKNTLVIVDDVLPVHSKQACRERKTRAWTGDVWKVYFALSKYRPDLTLLLLDAYPTGLLLITNLNPINKELEENYDSILKYYHDGQSVPRDVLDRVYAISSLDVRVDEMLISIKDNRV